MSKKLRLGAAIGVCLAGILSGLFIYTNSQPLIKNGVKYTRNWKGQTIEAEIVGSKAEQTKKVTAKVTKNEELKTWEIVDNSQTPPLPTGIYYHQNNESESIIKWNEYIIGYTKDYFVARSGGGYIGSWDVLNLQSTIRHIRILNTKTGEVYSISLQKPTWGEIESISVQILENKYFLSVGSYGPRSPMFQYRLQLPATRNSKIEKLIQPIGYNIKKYGNVYVSAWCYEGCIYNRVDINTSKSIDLKRLDAAANHYYSDKPEELVGFTNNGEMVLNIAKTNKKIAVSLLDEKTTRDLLSNEQIIDPDANQNWESLQKHFESLGLNEKYVLEERSFTYKTSHVSTYEKDELPEGAEILEQ